MFFDRALFRGESNNGIILGVTTSGFGYGIDLSIIPFVLTKSAELKHSVIRWSVRS